MSIETYINSDDFRLFLDEPLRRNACNAVEKFFEINKPVKTTQLHSIPLVIQAGGLNGLRKLVENQISKNTKKENKEFWKFINELLFQNPVPDFSLRAFIQAQPEIRAFLKDETQKDLEKKERNQIKKANKNLIETVLEHLLLIYFEHFNCHYFYINNTGKGT